MSIPADFNSFKTHFTSKYGTNGYSDLKAILLEEDLERLLNDETFERSVAKRLLLKGSLRNDGFFGAKASAVLQEFVLRLPAEVSSVSLVGSFTNWGNNPLSMTPDSARKTWRTKVLLALGFHEYKFFVDGKFFEDPRVPTYPPYNNHIIDVKYEHTTINFRALLQENVSQIDEDVFRRMLQRFPSQVNTIVGEQRGNLALSLYQTTLLLPQAQTESELKLHGIFIDVNLFVQNENLTICFKRTKPCLLKPLTPVEYTRMENILQHIKVDGRMINERVVDMELVVSGTKKFAIMPLLPTTLEQLVIYNSEDAERLYFQTKEAISALHNCGFAHMDVKPANICIDSNGDFVLIDFGSAVLFGANTNSTPAYIPHGINTRPAKAIVDWWMLAATLTDRVCNYNRWGVGARNPTKQETLQELRKLPSSVYSDLEQLLQIE